MRLVPLQEIIAETLGVGDSSNSVKQQYLNLVEKLGSETDILMRRKTEEIANIGGEKLAEGVLKVRSGNIFVKPGFDGEYGKVKVWPSSAKDPEGKEEKNLEKEQMSLLF